ncbi:hypothetical protein [Orrella marina]|uniref:Uncharacterized protein n=1 Tax=Orrella marina TaxID=2163011 RepID=A0A2R4XFI9_9BURK|nr:hypothetical protein [Orrella marina]AWB32509.1 hypothetical protein DBV39_00890 [Orrella marina]
MSAFAVVFRPLFFVLALWLCVIPRMAQAQAQDTKLAIELWAEAESFRSLASQNFLMALRSASTPDANLTFAELGKALWREDAGADGWSVFFRHSLINFVAGGSELEFVAFQHPWADIVLMTGWSRSSTDSRLRIVVVGMAMGSVARGAKAPFPTGLAWMNGKRYAPEAVGELNASTTNAIASFEAGITRNPFADIGEAGGEAMVAGAALQWMEHQVNLSALFGNHPKARAMRFAWNELIVAGQRGTLGKILPPAISADIFKAIEPELWATLEPVVYLESSKTAVALFTSWRNPDVYAVLTLRGDDDHMEIVDFGFYRFSGFITEDAQ